MIAVRMLRKDGRWLGFRIGGHSGAGAQGHDIICAAISSAAQMTANTITETCRLTALVRQHPGYLLLSLSHRDAPAARELLLGMGQHMAALAAQYPRYIDFQVLEV